MDGDCELIIIREILCVRVCARGCARARTSVCVSPYFTFHISVKLTRKCELRFMHINNPFGGKIHGG